MIDSKTAMHASYNQNKKGGNLQDGRVDRSVALWCIRARHCVPRKGDDCEGLL